MSKDTVQGLNKFETIKIKPNEFGTDEVANRPHAYLEGNDFILEDAIENFSISDLADVVEVGSDPHTPMPMSGDEYTPIFLSRTGSTSGEWNSDTLKQDHIDHVHPALTEDGKCRIGDGFWYIQDISNITVQVFSQQADYTPLAAGAFTYFYGGDNGTISSDIRATLTIAQALSYIPIVKAYSTDGLTFDYIEDMRPIYTPAQLTDVSSPSGAIIAQYSPWSITFTINSANSGANNSFTFNEPYLAGKGILNVYLNGLKQPVRDFNNPTGSYTELDPYSIMFNDALETGDILVVHSDLGYIRNVGINADFTPGSIAVEMPTDQNIGYIEELPFNYPSGMHMLHVFRNGVRLTSGLDYEEAGNGVLDNKSITFKITLKESDVIVYHSPSTFVTNLSLTGNSFNYYEIMHGASNAYKNEHLTENFDGTNEPSISGPLAGMHFTDVLTTSTSGSAIPTVTEFDDVLGITSDTGSYENVGQFSGQINWGSTTSLIEFRGLYTGYNDMTIPAASAGSIDLPDGDLLEIELGSATYGLQLDYVNRQIDHIGLVGLIDSDSLSSTEQLISTLELKSFRSKAGDQFITSFNEWRSFNTAIPSDTLNSKSLVDEAWSIFNSNYPTNPNTMDAASGVFLEDIVTKLTVAGQNYEESSKKDAHLDATITLDWSNQLVYTSGTLKSHRGTIFAIGEVFAMGNAPTDYDVYFMDEDDSSSTGRPKFVFNITPETGEVSIAFQAGADGFESTNASKWAFTTIATRSKVESIPSLPDRLTLPGSYYQTTSVNYSGKIDSSSSSITYGTIDSSRTIEGYNTISNTKITESNLFPILVPSDTHRTELTVKTKQFAIYEGTYNILIDWLNSKFEVTYEGLLIRDDGFNIIGKESGEVNTFLQFGLNSDKYVYDELGTTYPTGNQGNPELPTVIDDQLERLGVLDVQINPSDGVRSIIALPIIEAISINPSYFDITVRNYKSLNG